MWSALCARKSWEAGRRMTIHSIHMSRNAQSALGRSRGVRSSMTWIRRASEYDEQLFILGSNSRHLCSFVFKDASRLPSNKALEKARLDSFGGKRKWWPHDANKLHGATSKKVVYGLPSNHPYSNRLAHKLAKAGFVYTPQESGVQDDTATCFYCDLSLSGWDPEDDPVYVYLSSHFTLTFSKLH